MTSPVVSIIIPAYNYGHFISDGLASLQQQSFTDFECIVIDDGSTDNTREIVCGLGRSDKRIKYVFQPNRGQPAARNAGLGQATGQYLQFLDADDLLQSEKLLTQVKFMTDHRAISVVYGDVFYFTGDNRTDIFINRWGLSDEEWMPRVGGWGLPVIQAYVSGNLFELGCALFRASEVSAAGMFNTALQGVEDYDYCFRMALKNKSFAYLSRPGSAVLMRQHAASFSKSRLKMYQQEIKMRLACRQELHQSYPNLAIINDQKSKNRLRQLQNLLIDLRRKKQIGRPQWEILTWIWANSSVNEKLYFFPRWVKAETEVLLRLT